jgi:hypothetical protein
MGCAQTVSLVKVNAGKPSYHDSSLLTGVLKMRRVIRQVHRMDLEIQAEAL